jgi:hypothetical protein
MSTKFARAARATEVNLKVNIMMMNGMEWFMIWLLLAINTADKICRTGTERSGELHGTLNFTVPDRTVGSRWSSTYVLISFACRLLPSVYIPEVWREEIYLRNQPDKLRGVIRRLLRWRTRGVPTDRLPALVKVSLDWLEHIGVECFPTGILAIAFSIANWKNYALAGRIAARVNYQTCLLFLPA